MTKSILERLAKPNFFTIFIGVLVAACMWLLPLFFMEIQEVVPCLLWDGTVIAYIPGLAAHLIQFALFIVLAFMIQQLVERLQIYPERSFMPFFLFLLLGSTLSEVQYFDSATISFLLILVSYYQLIKSYNIQKSYFSSFNSALALGCAALFQPIFVVFIPLLWFGLFKLRSLNAKTLLASMSALFLVIYTLVAIYFLTDGLDNLLFNLDALYLFDTPSFSFSPIQLSFAFLAVVLIVFILFVMQGAHSFSKLNIRDTNGFFMIALFYTLVVLLFSQFNYHALVYIVFFITSVLFGFYFSTSDSKLATILFYVTLLTSVAYRCVDVFIS